MKYTYDHMEQFDGVTFPDFKQYDQNLILYGAGINGALCAFALKELGVEFLCFCDSNPEKEGTSYLGHPVYTPLECSRRFPHAAILFDAYVMLHSLDHLTDLGFHNVLFPAGLFLGLDCDRAARYITDVWGRGGDGYSFREEVDASQVFEWIDEYMIRGANYAAGKRTPLPRALNVDITDRCTLRCKNCLAFKPYYHKPKDTPWPELEQAIDPLLSMKWFRRVHILGGEPLLYADLDRLLHKLTAAPEIEHIVIITNGTVIPGQAVLDACRNPKVLIRVSYYEGLSAQYRQLEEICKTNGINIRVHAQRWTDVGRLADTVHSQAEAKEIYDLCCQSEASLFYIMHGKATYCPFAANTEALGLFEATSEDFVDLLGDIPPQTLFDRLQTLYTRKKPLQACRYCNGWSPYGNQSIPVAEQYPEGEVPHLPQHEA